MSDYLDAMFSLGGKVAVVIGGTGELCGAMGEGLAAAGAEAVLVGRDAAEAAPRLARIAAAGGRGYFLPVEADDKQGLEGLLAAVLARSGRVDIVVNGAGMNSATPFFEIGEEEFDRIMGVNFKGVFFGCQVFGRYLVGRGEGARSSTSAPCRAWCPSPASSPTRRARRPSTTCPGTSRGNGRPTACG